ncbi:hypothetical protein GLOIN_2v1506277 [Rhizophagus irregularis DAOM 181602=DAOM 197198]|uniref:Uncharacterized protein n=1 Tax=Rhizophagus irregularis (strain DAOM 181602 / DAOM 197198 / MUCL 43194) TaxID=747089 RepID=A0A2P4QV98_RHIID|nr:hypothetical protein GLOIN_2v1506277 [Rhizophagus irregularis DAOM 181602=DAOM 197198]POG81555.1 hypothetical protein GLOIN_2v1506277 [Rhizophagus irregularis DAOM 181602=DAOM 197198]|eukprot:XP_025188421.1 hypothetical protein GLOIN_2v1506277 [Rhizophagus irregularis DAOM 181602=DAOM 197198]
MPRCNCITFIGFCDIYNTFSSLYLLDERIILSVFRKYLETEWDIIFDYDKQGRDTCLIHTDMFF